MAHISSETRQSVKIDVRGFNPLSRDVPKFKGSCFGLFSLKSIHYIYKMYLTIHKNGVKTGLLEVKVMCFAPYCKQQFSYSEALTYATWK